MPSNIVTTIYYVALTHDELEQLAAAFIRAADQNEKVLITDLHHDIRATEDHDVVYDLLVRYEGAITNDETIRTFENKKRTDR